MSHRDVVGVTNVEGPPVPIPNTEVKLNSAEDTWLEAARENRSTPTSFLLITYSSLAQSVERMTVNHDVAGSSPAGGAKSKTESIRTLFCFSFSLVRLGPVHAQLWSVAALLL